MKNQIFGLKLCGKQHLYFRAQEKLGALALALTLAKALAPAQAPGAGASGSASASASASASERERQRLEEELKRQLDGAEQQRQQNLDVARRLGATVAQQTKELQTKLDAAKEKMRQQLQQVRGGRAAPLRVGGSRRQESMLARESDRGSPPGSK